jgi:hypothetical protein
MSVAQPLQVGLYAASCQQGIEGGMEKDVEAYGTFLT